MKNAHVTKKTWDTGHLPNKNWTERKVTDLIMPGTVPETHCSEPIEWYQRDTEILHSGQKGNGTATEGDKKPIDRRVDFNVDDARCIVVEWKIHSIRYIDTGHRFVEVKKPIKSWELTHHVHVDNLGNVHYTQKEHQFVECAVEWAVDFGFCEQQSKL